MTKRTCDIADLLKNRKHTDPYLSLESKGDSFLVPEAMIDAAVRKIECLHNALVRLASTEAFFVATSKIDPETYGRLEFAQTILRGEPYKSSIEMAERAALQHGGIYRKPKDME